MTNIKYLEQSLPVAPLKIAALESCRGLGEKVNDHIVNFRKEAQTEILNSPLFANYHSDNFLIDCKCPRFGSGEAKGYIGESIRGSDLFLMVDVCNYNLTYTVNGFQNHMSPDDHYQDLKRIISAAQGKAHRVSVIMPFLYESRACAISSRPRLLQTRMAMSPRVSGASPRCSVTCSRRPRPVPISR